MKPVKPFGLSLPVAVLLLLALYLAVVIDVVTGLHMNLFGYGREPWMFAMGSVVVACALYGLGRPWLGMIGVALCCIWLVFYPAKNGFDAVLSPLLAVGIGAWLWQKNQSKP